MLVLNAGNVLLIGSVLLFFSILAGKASFKFGVPALLIFFSCRNDIRKRRGRHTIQQS